MEDFVIEHARLEDELHTLLSLTTTAEVREVNAFVKEIMHLRALNPRAFRMAVMLILSTLLAAGDTIDVAQATDLQRQFERMVQIQQQIDALVLRHNEGQLNRLLGLDRAEPTERVN